MSLQHAIDSGIDQTNTNICPEQIAKSPWERQASGILTTIINDVTGSGNYHL